MSRRLLLMLSALAVIACVAGSPGARADRLGGNFRGPGDIYIVRQDTSSSAPAGGQAGTSSGAPAPTGGTTGDSSGDGGMTSGSGDSGSSGDGGSAPPDGGGEGGGSSAPPDGGGEGGEGGDGGAAPPPTGGGSDGGSDTGGTGSAPPAGGATGGSTSTSGGSSSSGTPGKGKGGAEDKDKIWPFYVESAKEEYIATVLSRRPDLRLAPPHSSTGMISPLPSAGRERRPIGETDRLEAKELVMGRLADPDSHVRDAAVVALGKSGYKDTIHLLQKAAESDPDPAVREDALLALGLSGQKDVALPVLLKALNSSPSNKREHRSAYAALGLGLLGDREGASESLRKFYQATVTRPDLADEAACAAAALGMLGDPQALPIFQKAVGSKAISDPVRSYTLHAVGKYGTHADEKVRKEALVLLLNALLEKKAAVKQSALLALGAFDEPSVVNALFKEGISDSDTYARVFAAHSLGRIAGRLPAASPQYASIAKRLAEVSENTNKDRWLFQAANISLSAMAYAEQEKQLLTLLGDKKLDPNSSSAVALGLGLLGTESPVVAKELKGLFESKSSGNSVQAYAGLALAMTGNRQAADSLGKLFTNETRPNADVARAAALAIGLVGGAKDADLLIEILNGTKGGQQADSAKFFLKGAAVQGLGLIGDGDTVKKLKAMMTSTDWDQRAFATAALGFILAPGQDERISPRISGIFRHHNYHLSVPVVKAVQSTL